MPKQTHSHTIHVEDEEQEIINERAARFRSRNAYFIHCIRVEAEHARRAENGRDRAIAECTHKIIRLTLEQLREEEAARGPQQTGPSIRQ